MELVEVGPHKLYFGDCLEVLPTLEEESVQLTITSPPYAIGKEYELKQSYQDLVELVRLMSHHLLLVTKSSGFCLVNFPATTRFSYLQEQMYHDVFVGNGWVFHSRRVWQKAHQRVKLAPSGINLSIPSAEFENLFTFRKPPNKKEADFERRIAIRGVWKIEELIGWKGIEGDSILDRDIHPAQFPVELPILAMRVWSEPGDVVFDPFGGVFTTVIAADHEDRIGIAVEKEDKYFRCGVQRVQNCVSQQQMFGVEEMNR